MALKKAISELGKDDSEVLNAAKDALKESLGVEALSRDQEAIVNVMLD